MASAKSVFERPATSDTSPKLSKRVSKWDKPRPVAPPAVNRDAENMEQSAADSELPPPAYTKNMLAKFQLLQDGQQIKDSEPEDYKPKKLWEDGTRDDSTHSDMTNSRHCCHTTSEKYGAATAGDFKHEESGCLSVQDSGCDSEKNNAELEECKTNEEDREYVDDAAECTEQVCLISLDDDDDDEQKSNPAVNSNIEEYSVEKTEDCHLGDGITSRVLDANPVSSDQASVREWNAGEM